MTIGARLRAARVRRGLTLGDVAGTELSVGLVSKLERDLVNPSLQTLQYLAGRLGVRPGDLLADERDATLRSARGALDAARSRLLLGDPAAAATEALHAAGDLAELGAVTHMGLARAAAGLRARLWAVAADAALVTGDAGRAALYVRDASALVAGAGDGAAQCELAWVLGALERRRGALADAERTWTRCLASVEEREPSSAPLPWWQYLRASLLAELGGLAEAQGDAERARNLVARAASIAAGVAHAAGPAAGLLATWATVAGDSPATDGDVAQDASADTVIEPPAAPHAALALVVIAAADRLGRRLTQEAARLERAAWEPGPRAPDVAVTRGLR